MDRERTSSYGPTLTALCAVDRKKNFSFLFGSPQRLFANYGLDVLFSNPCVRIRGSGKLSCITNFLEKNLMFVMR